MPKPTSKLKNLRANKSGPINQSLFNFLENLLVFRTMPELAVPPESSVKFRITRQEGDPGICLLIHVDEQLFPIVGEGVPRPDYLAIYLHGNDCLCTIIEMKSTAGRNLKHGIEQIKTLADILNQEFELHLHPRFRLHIQGILLCPFNAQIPNNLIVSMARSGLTILPAQCHTRAELYPYVSTKNDLKYRFESKPRSPTQPSLIEKMMSQDTLCKRVPDDLTKARHGPGAGTGLHICFVLSDKDEYAVLITRGNKCVFVVCEQGDQYLKKLRAEIDANNLGRKFDVERMSKTER